LVGIAPVEKGAIASVESIFGHWGSGAALAADNT
jgi:hypothetical protein